VNSFAVALARQLEPAEGDVYIVTRTDF
jgi:hypothetical protein